MKNMNAETPYIRAPVCEAKGRMNLCTKCTNLRFTLPKLTFTLPNLRFKVLQVQPLSAALGQAYKSGNGKNRQSGKSVTQIGTKVYPVFQFAEGSFRTKIGAIDLGQFGTPVCTYDKTIHS